MSGDRRDWGPTVSAGIDQARQLAAAGYIAGALLTAVDDLGHVIPVQDADRNYTGEVRFQFLGEWYSVACPTPIEAP